MQVRNGLHWSTSLWRRNNGKKLRSGRFQNGRGRSGTALAILVHQGRR
ncbi:hypothetical protein C4K11_1754 [Pseudomonas chlororaphis subsp. aureofaciens]|nr:hypothetical protein C4K14_1793 [Pseudomonas chlororaphis subsp. aureofaciens]AZD91239.1 hypothetical protein C4K13_1807 [Pseudomonas chlororaphis subsp. aureofaciens]AZE03931.1 hypothetical protein C4K11_1754 [Pseudomonas chlororaphis subsp. aureofaciens]